MLKLSLLQEAADGQTTANVGAIVKKPPNISKERNKCPCLVFQHRTGLMSKTVTWKLSHISSWLHREPWYVSFKESIRYVLGAECSNNDIKNLFCFSKAIPPLELYLISFICQVQRRTQAVSWLLGELHEIVHVKYLAHSTRHTVSIRQMVVNWANNAYGVASNMPGTKHTFQECDCYSLGPLFHYPRPQISPPKKHSLMSTNTLRARELATMLI